MSIIVTKPQLVAEKNKLLCFHYWKSGNINIYSPQKVS